ncbi:uncharacterized protein TNCV_5069581 [Trichonephila clavipes]|nr:uncharacterized protein TNCV_5069581 [Trichonephila clavipes]
MARRMIGKLEEGRSLTNVAEEFGINKGVVSHARKAFQTIGTAVGKVGGGHPRKTIAVDERYIVLQVQKARYQSTSTIAQPQGDKCRCLLWPDAFPMVSESPAVRNAASFWKLDILSSKLHISLMESRLLYV